ncbi:MAG: metal-dependent hydrolase [Bacteriovoracaceae bacterium]
MASLISHPAAPLALIFARGEKWSGKLAIICVLLSCLPDADAIGFFLGVPYESQWGHRGFTHSLAFALMMGLASTFFFRENKKNVFILTTLSTFSHPLADMLTNGGLGVALWWPITSARYFFPWRPIEVSPIGIANFIGWRGVRVLLSEVLVLWIPLMSLAFLTKRLGR